MSQDGLTIVQLSQFHIMDVDAYNDTRKDVVSFVFMTDSLDYTVSFPPIEPMLSMMPPVPHHFFQYRPGWCVHRPSETILRYVPTFTIS